ncbi:hypothetical protein GTP45_01100 [Pseudoduganella sp. FT55W]|uniref:Bacteriophage tail tape measure N-terminal domain-containing protein n=1 Tax=Duganella rivi TaxID=2666083 RepID=A0A7X4GMW9_9BURK|nr:hypothetical protein [Duganella rivi]
MKIEMAETRVLITAEATQAIAEYHRLRTEATGALNSMAGGGDQLRRLGVSAAQTAAALRQVPAQFTDIVVSLQAGQNPLTVLLQQGGQLRDMFGSTGAAARALGGYALGLINPYTVLAAAAAAVGYAYYQGSKEAAAFNRAIVMSGNAAGVTKDQLASMAREIGSGDATQKQAAAAIAALTETGRVGRENLKAFATTAVNAEKSVGIALTSTVKDFEDLGKSPVQATLRLNERYNFLTAAVYEQIVALERKGDVDAAGDLAQKAYAAALDQRTAGIKANLGTLESAWEWVGLKASKAWDFMLNVGREDTLDDKINDVKSKLQKIKLEQMTFVGSSAENRADSNKRKAILQAELSGLEDRKKKEGEVAASKKAANDLEQAKIKWMQDGEKYLPRQLQLENAIAKARAEGAAAHASDEAISKRIAQITQSYGDIANDAIDSQIEAIKRRGATEDAVIRRSVDLLTSKNRSGLVLEEDYIRAVAQLDNAAFEKEKSRLAEELALTAKKQNSQKDQAALRGQIAQLSAQQATRALQEQNELEELEVRRSRAAAENYANAVEKQQAVNRSLADQIIVQRDANAEIGLTKAGQMELTIARLEDRAALAEQNAEIADGLDFSGKLSEEYRRQAQQLRDLATAKRAGAVKQEASDKFSAKDLEDYLDPMKAKSFGDALKDAFGGAGDALTKLRASLQDYGIAQTTVERARAAAAVAYANDSKKLSAANIAITQKETQVRMGAYGDIAGAASEFFGEQSKGYKVLQGVSQAFHLAQLAMNLASIGPAIAAGAAQMFAQSGFGGFAGVAAMIGVMAALGASTGGGGGSGGMSAADMQKTQGTGSVFGDSSAKSDSIRHSIELLTQNSNDMLPINQGMLTALKNIESSMVGLTNLVVRTTGLTDGANMGIQTGTIATGGPTALAGSAGLGAIAGGLLAGPLGAAIGGAIGGAVSKLWGKTTQKIVDSGLQYGGSVRSLQAGQGFEQYASIDTTKSSWFGLSKSTSNRIETQGLNDELSKQFGLIFTNLDKSLQAASEAMGGSAADIIKVLDNLTLESTKVSLKGLTGTELTDALNSVISKSMDEIAAAAFPELDKFRQVGEGYAETVMRIAGDYAKLDAILAATGSTFGATGIASVSARERLIELAGGIDELASQSDNFAKDFLSKAEQLAPVQKYVTDQLAKMGLQSLDTREKFKDYVLGLASSGALLTDAGAQQYATLLGLAKAFAETHAATEDLTKTEQEIADERKTLRNQLDELTMSSAQLLAKERDALDESNRALFDQVQAAKASADAHAKAAEAIKAAQESSAAATLSLGNALADSIKKATEAAAALRKFNDELSIGDLSPLSSQAKYELSKDALLRADSDNIQSAANKFLEASKARGAGSLSYATDFAFVKSLIEKMAGSKSDFATSAASFWQTALKNGAIGAHENGGVASGLSLVGERGPELANFAQPARIYTASQTRAILNADSSGGLTEATAQRLIYALEVVATNTGNSATASKKAADILQRVTRDGDALVTTSE